MVGNKLQWQYDNYNIYSSYNKKLACYCKPTKSIHNFNQLHN